MLVYEFPDSFPNRIPSPIVHLAPCYSEVDGIGWYQEPSISSPCRRVWDQAVIVGINTWRNSFPTTLLAIVDSSVHAIIWTNRLFCSPWVGKHVCEGSRWGRSNAWAFTGRKGWTSSESNTGSCRPVTTAHSLLQGFAILWDKVFCTPPLQVSTAQPQPRLFGVPLLQIHRRGYYRLGDRPGGF